jgi:hypothetical protein
VRTALLLTVSLGLLAAPFVAIGAIDKEKAAAPAGEKAEGGQRDGVVAVRERAQREYREMRERRHEALLAAARRSSKGDESVGVPGWRGSGDSSAKLVEVAMAAGVDEQTGTEVATEPAEELPGGQSFFLLIVASGVFLCLALRFIRPDWFYALRLRNIALIWGAIRERHRAETEEMERGPITMKLRPREKRRLKS